MSDSLGTNMNIVVTRDNPIIDKNGIFSIPIYWVTKAAIRGPKEKPREPILIKKPISSAQVLHIVPNLFTNPLD